MKNVFDVTFAEKTTYHFTSPQDVNAFYASLRMAVAVGKLGVPHR